MFGCVCTLVLDDDDDDDDDVVLLHHWCLELGPLYVMVG